MASEDIEKEEGRDVFGNNWENPPTQRDLHNNLSMSRSTHAEVERRIRDWKALLKPKPAKGKANQSKVQPKLVRRNNEWRYTSLSEPFLNTPDMFKVEPVTAEDVKAAEMNQILINNQFNTKIRKQKLIDRMVRKVVDEGSVTLRVGWETSAELLTKVEPVYEMQETTNPRHIREIEAARQRNDPENTPKEIIECVLRYQSTGIYFYPVKTGETTYEEVEVKRNHPTVEVVDTENVIVDPSCNGDIEDAQFVIYSYESTMSDLKKDDRYKNVDKIEPENQSVLADTDHYSGSDWSSSGFRFQDDARKKVVVYEYWGYWDIHDTGEAVPILVVWVGNTIIRMEENPYPDQQHPFIVATYLPIDGSVYGEPDAELLEDHQAITGALTRGMIDLMGKSANSQTGIRKGALDYLNRAKFLNGQDYEFNSEGDAQRAIFQHTFPEIPASAYNMLQMQQQEAESLTGVKAFAQGITGQGLGETAAAANGALSAAARRELGILRRLSDCMSTVARKIISMNQAFLSEEEVVRITGGKFVTVRRDDIGGKFDLRLSISTAEADEQKAQELAFMLQTTGQNFGLGMYQLILSEIAKLRKMPELADKIMAYKPEPDPMQQIELQKAQLEIEKLKAETQKILAEAGKASALTDRENLNYVEQESGVNHARDLEKQQAQALGNIELERAKSMLAQDKPTQDNPQ